MIQARTDAARLKAGVLGECLLALGGFRDAEDETTAIDAHAAAFVLAESLQMWRRSVKGR